jgi:hypothetical protein
MKTRFGSLLWKTALVLVIAGAIGVVLILRPNTGAQQAVAATRQALRDQGFKTDLSDFDFSTSPELRAREAILKATASGNHSEPFRDHPNLMENIGDDAAVVVWKQDSLKRAYPSWPDNNDKLTWEEFRDALNAD